MKNYLQILLFTLLLPTLTKAQEEVASPIERPCPNLFNIVKNDKTYTLRYASNHVLTEPNKKNQATRHLHSWCKA
jgi:hypothetical protein